MLALFRRPRRVSTPNRTRTVLGMESLNRRDVPSAAYPLTVGGVYGPGATEYVVVPYAPGTPDTTDTTTTTDPTDTTTDPTGTVTDPTDTTTDPTDTTTDPADTTTDPTGTTTDPTDTTPTPDPTDTTPTPDPTDTGPPAITSFSAIEDGNGLFLISGQVQNPSPGGTLVMIGGMTSCAGQSTITNDDGSFSLVVQLNTDGTDFGWITAVATSATGQSSGEAEWWVEPTPP